MKANMIKWMVDFMAIFSLVIVKIVKDNGDAEGDNEANGDGDGDGFFQMV